MNKRAEDEGKRSPLRALTSGMEQICGMLGDEMRIELRGRGEMFVCGCKRILSYTESEIELLTRDDILTVRGEGLTCASFHCSGLVIEGRVNSIELESLE